jgi:hypothetical protein
MFEAGDVLEFILSVRCGSGKVYYPGETLTLLEKTGLDPFGQGASLKTEHNWLVKCRYFSPPDQESVWATIYQMFERGLIQKVEADE